MEKSELFAHSKRTEFFKNSIPADQSSGDESHRDQMSLTMKNAFAMTPAHHQTEILESHPVEGVSPTGELQSIETSGPQNVMQSPDFFKMSGMPRFGKQWLDNFIDDPELQNTFLTSEVVRNVLMLQCIFFASIYNDLMIYKQAFLKSKEGEHQPETDN
jgi:hypothetical protein